MFPSDINGSVGKKCRILFICLAQDHFTLYSFIFKKKVERGLGERVDYFTICQYFCIQKLYDKSKPFLLLWGDTCEERGCWKRMAAMLSVLPFAPRLGKIE